jgi:hypothetical protein
VSIKVDASAAGRRDEDAGIVRVQRDVAVEVVVVGFEASRNYWR